MLPFQLKPSDSPGPDVRTVARVVTVEKEKEKVATNDANESDWKDKCMLLEDVSWLHAGTDSGVTIGAYFWRALAS